MANVAGRPSDEHLYSLTDSQLMAEYGEAVQQLDAAPKKREIYAAEIDRRFRGRLICLARKKMCDELKQKEGVSAIVQSFIARFLQNPNLDSVDMDADVDSLWKILAYRFERRVRDYLDRYKPGGRRDWRREVSMTLMDLPKPSPSDALEFMETLESVRIGLSDDEWELLELVKTGASVADVAKAHQVGTHAIYARLRQLRAKISRLLSL